jgi:hypothetical protein
MTRDRFGWRSAYPCQLQLKASNPNDSAQAAQLNEIARLSEADQPE